MSLPLGARNLDLMQTDLALRYGDAVGAVSEDAVVRTLARIETLAMGDDADGPPTRMAAAYAHTLVVNAPFRSLNRCTALAAMATVLALKGYALGAPEHEVVAVMSAAGTREGPHSMLTRWLRARCRPQG